MNILMGFLLLIGLVAACRVALDALRGDMERLKLGAAWQVEARQGRAGHGNTTHGLLTKQEEKNG